MVLLGQQLGPASLTAAVCLVALVPVNTWLVNVSNRMLKVRMWVRGCGLRVG